MTGNSPDDGHERPGAPLPGNSMSHAHDIGPAGTEPPRERWWSGRHWMMLACCIPMIVVALALVLTGVASAGALVIAPICALLMGMMMVGMGRGDGDGDGGHH